MLGERLNAASIFGAVAGDCSQVRIRAQPITLLGKLVLCLLQLRFVEFDAIGLDAR